MLIFLILLFFILIAAGLAWYFISHDKGEKEPIGALWLAFGFGFLGGIAAAIIEGVVLSNKNLTHGAPVMAIFLSAMAVGVIEESCKFLPLSFFLWPKRYFNEHTDGVIYFALAGLGFGLPENILYTLQFGASAGVGRLVMTPFFHAATTGMVGYFLIRCKLEHRSRTTAFAALGAAMVLHGFYDFGLISMIPVFVVLSILITLTMSVGLFIFYGRATELDQKQGLSAVGNNKFCRSCGMPNVNHNLYCTRCGNYA